MDGVNLGPVIDAVRRAESNINSNISVVNSNLGIIDDKVREVNAELLRLKSELEAMRKEQRFAAALQRAITEVIRIRQELDQKFGTQQIVRDNMLGILQATDLGLITESTISRCTEELMLSAPKYWLAPCLIALAAWISNNEPLAKRAIAEGYKRDKEKTCLLFALITRRVNAGRMQAKQPTSNATFEWLSRYFSFQDPLNMKRSIIAYIDAYSNGIFGPDKDNICAEQIDYWMNELKVKDPSFAERQNEYWKNFFQGYCNAAQIGEYAQLKLLSPQYANMEKYLESINAAERQGGIKTRVGYIMNQPVDTEKLIGKIDDQLGILVKSYEEGEESELRDKEEEYQRIKKYEGDEVRAMTEIEAERGHRAWLNQTFDFAQRLALSISDPNTEASEKKTALVMLKPYIEKAYNEFITAYKDQYPNGEIDLIINNAGQSFNGALLGNPIVSAKALRWQGKTIDGENREELIASLSAEFDKMKADRVAAITDDEANKTKKMGIILSCFILPAVIGIPKILKANKMKKDNATARVQVAEFYNKAKAANIKVLNMALDQRHTANDVVKEFLSNEENEKINI